VVSRLPIADASASMKGITYVDLSLGLVATAAAGVSVIVVGGASGLLGAGLALLMLAIAIADARYLIIPNELTAAAFALALVNAAVAETASVIEAVAFALLRGTVVMLFFLAIRAIYGWLREREGLGLGDVKLAFVAGAWLDWTLIPVAVEIAALAALAAYLVLQLLGKRPVDTASRLPFGLFLGPAIWLSWLFGRVIFGSI
jgi:leader peptidase (prepilin peptidase) / N-methyltransferase